MQESLDNKITSKDPVSDQTIPFSSDTALTLDYATLWPFHVVFILHYMHQRSLKAKRYSNKQIRCITLSLPF